MKRIIAAEALPDYRVKLRFDDGVAGVVDLSGELSRPVFSGWRRSGQFGALKIGHGGRSLEWPGDIDLCADALYLEITGIKVEELFPNAQRESAHA